ncbi:MAG: methionyl-tRNA synthetase [Chlamydiales bacterium]|jgi:methionyl-tRNA synthetase
MSQKVLITSALPYANGPLHFGHIAGAYLPADCYARFKRMEGSRVLYVCGSDEHGVAITIKAKVEGRSPKEHVDIFHKVIKTFFDKLNFSFDHYSRTTWEGHKAPTIEYFNDLMANGYIEPRITDQLYSVDEDRFLADRYVVGTCPKCGFENARGDECPKCGASYEATDLLNPRSKLSNSPLILKPTKHWFLLCDKLKDQLLEWIEKKNWKPNVVNFAKKYMEDLRPRAITRDSKWGIPVPLEGAEGKVFYVWFDAPIGYISASMEWAQENNDADLWKEFWLDPETKYVQFLGKDNIPFHAVFFPAMTLGQNQPYKTVDDLSANEFLNLEGRAFSKSDGWYIDLDDFFTKYSTDQIRYSLAANAPETSDSEFKWKDFQKHCNSELLGKFGNLVNRALVFSQKQCAGKVPYRSELTEEIDVKFLSDIKGLVKDIAESYDTYRMRRASQQIMELAQLGNVYFDAKKPWTDAKEESTRPRLMTTISCCLECLKALALTSSPIIPETADKLWKMLGYDTNLVDLKWESVMSETVPAAQVLPKPSVLFRKIEDEEIEMEIEKLNAMAEESKPKVVEYPPLKNEISFDDFTKLDLRVATVLAATKVPKSKKLLEIQVDLGFEKRTVVSGISQFYDPEGLVGKKVVVVANLKPTKLMGIQSQGMILTGVLEESLELLSPGEIPPGGVVC